CWRPLGKAAETQALALLASFPLIPTCAVRTQPASPQKFVASSRRNKGRVPGESTANSPQIGRGGWGVGKTMLELTTRTHRTLSLAAAAALLLTACGGNNDQNTETAEPPAEPT